MDVSEDAFHHVGENGLARDDGGLPGKYDSVKVSSPTWTWVVVCQFGPILCLETGFFCLNSLARKDLVMGCFRFG